MATIKFLLQSKSDNATIYLRLSINKDTSFKRKTGLFVNAKDWITKKGLPKQNTATNKNLTTDLEDLRNYISKQVNSANSNAELITSDWLFNAMEVFFKRASSKGQSELVICAIQDIINTANTRDNGKGGVGLSKCRINSYKRLLVLFTEFQKDKNYKVTQLDKMVFDSFKKWLLGEKEYSATYSLKKLSDLKTVCKDARSNGVEASTELNDIKTKQVATYEDDMEVVILTSLEIEKIENATLTRDALVNARKWLILAVFTGQRGQSLTTRIKKENFERYGTDLVIKIRQKKGNKSVIIPVLPKVKEIYENGMPYTISLTKLNKHFKEIGKIAGLNEPTMGRIIEVDIKGKKRGVKKLRPKYQYISTHIGRRSFASNHYGKIPTPIIMRVTGHSKESTFLGYINQTDDSHVDTFLDYYKAEELKEQQKEHPKLRIVKKASNS